MFKENEYVVYNHQVCKVKTIKKNYIQGKDCYVLIPVDDESLIINVPTDNKNGNIRNIVSRDYIEEIINKISTIEIIKDNDKHIENEYKHLLSTGKHEDLIKIIKTTYLRNEQRKECGKKLSEKDGNYFAMAEKILYTEFSISLGKTLKKL